MAKDYSGWLNKAQAAAALEVSTKTIDRLAGQKLIQQALWRRPGKPAIAVFHPSDVEKLWKERNPDATTPFVVPKAQEDPAPVTETSLTRSPAPGAQNAITLLLDVLARGAAQQAAVALDRKLFLTLDEAVAYSGLPPIHLKRLIVAGELRPSRSMLAAGYGSAGGFGQAMSAAVPPELIHLLKWLVASGAFVGGIRYIRKRHNDSRERRILNYLESCYEPVSVDLIHCKFLEHVLRGVNLEYQLPRVRYGGNPENEDDILPPKRSTRASTRYRWRVHIMREIPTEEKVRDILRSMSLKGSVEFVGNDRWQLCR